MIVRDRANIDAARHAHADPATVLSSLGIRAKRTSRGAMICCLVHDDRSPSCHVYRAEDGTIAVRCHGCGWSTDVLGLVAAAHGLTMPRDLPRVLEVMGAAPSTPISRAESTAPSSVTDDVFAALAEDLLDRCPIRGSVESYLRSRGVLDEARAAGWGALPSVEAQGALVRELVRTYGREAWTASGLASKDGSGLAWPRHALLIPYRAPGVAGQIVNLQRRVTYQPSGKSTPKYVFPSGRSMSRWPFGGEAVEELGEETAIVFCEGAIDALTLRAAYREEGLDRIVLAIPSATSWRAEWARIAAGRLAIIATDADDEGERAAERMAPDLYAAGATRVQRARPADGSKDWSAAS